MTEKYCRKDIVDEWKSDFVHNIWKTMTFYFLFIDQITEMHYILNK